MRFNDFEKIMSSARMSRYVVACGGNTKKAMTLYRYNLKLSQELFTVISCFEVALRNSIDRHYSTTKGADWLRDAAMPTGMFNTTQCGKTPSIISFAVRHLPAYSHAKLIAEMDFGFWRYTFARHQFFAGGQTLLQIFPAKPTSTPTTRYDHNYIFNELEKINELRNRLAHHEPVCFQPGHQVKNTTYARQHYGLILQFFQWMSIDEGVLLYGIDHINSIANQIDAL